MHTNVNPEEYLRFLWFCVSPRSLGVCLVYADDTYTNLHVLSWSCEWKSRAREKRVEMRKRTNRKERNERRMNKRNQIGNIFFSVCMHFMLFFAIPPAIYLVIYLFSFHFICARLRSIESVFSFTWLISFRETWTRCGKFQWRPTTVAASWVNRPESQFGECVPRWHFPPVRAFLSFHILFYSRTHYTWMKTWCKRTHKTHLHLWVMSLVSTTKTMTTAHRHRQLSIEKTFIMIMFASLDTGLRQ